jgi:carboxyl-terminal processing protease
MLRVRTARFIVPLLLTLLVSTQDVAHGLVLYQSSSERKAIPDPEPRVTALVRNVVRELSAGKPVGGMDDSEAKAVQRTLASFGRLRSLELVNREVKTIRHYTYQLRFKDLVVFLTVDLNAEDKLEGLHFRGELPLQTRLKIFNTAWETVNKEYFDPEFGGVDWAAARQRYGAQAASAKSYAEFATVMQQMFQELRTSHVGILFNAGEVGPGISSPIIWTGLSLGDIDNEVVITRVLKGSPAEKAGLRLGFSIRRIDDAAVGNSGEANGRLSAAKEMHRITVVDHQDVTREVILQKQLPPADKLEQGTFDDSTWYAILESQRLPEDIGYIYFTSFHPALNNRLLAALESMHDARGIIIDLRGNHGGASEGPGLPMASKLLGKETLLGISRTRKGDYHSKTKSHENPYAGLVVMLVDGESGSASEVVTAGLQETGRAVVIGKKTSGGVLDAQIKPLPAGALLVYPVGQTRTPKGVVLEGRGVIPDIEVNLTRAELLRGRDVQLEAAREYIRTHSR